MTHSLESSGCPYGGAPTERTDVIFSTNREYEETFVLNLLHAAPNMSRVTPPHIKRSDAPRFVPWFWPDNELTDAVNLRKDIFLNDQDGVLHDGDNDPVVRAASQQLLELQTRYLVDNFPEYYAIEHDTEYGEVIVNKATDDKFSIHPGQDDWHPLAISGMLGQEDICMMQRTEQGTYKLAAGFLATPTHWGLSDFVDADMDTIHRHVSGYHEQAAHSRVRLKDTVDKALTDLPEYPDRQIVRNNVLIELNPALALPHGVKNKLKARDIKRDIGNHVFIRSERETLTRLPSPHQEFEVFTIKEHVFPVAALAKSVRRDQLLRAIRTNEELRSVLKNRKLLGPLTDYIASA